MTKEEMAIEFEEIALRKNYLDCDCEEAAELCEEWNRLIPEAKRIGFTSQEINNIWENRVWGLFN